MLFFAIFIIFFYEISGLLPCTSHFNGLIASASSDRTIKIWDLGYESSCAITLVNHTDKVNKVLFSADNLTLYSASDDGTVKYWDISTGVCYKTLLLHQRAVRGMALSSDGLYLASSSFYEIILWEARTGTFKASFTANFELYALKFTPNGYLLIAGGSKGIKIVNISKSQDYFMPFNYTASTLAISNDNRFLYVGSTEGQIQIFDLVNYTGRSVYNITVDSSINSLSLSPNGSLLLAVTNDSLRNVYNLNSKIYVSWQTKGQITNYTGIFTPDGKYIIEARFNNEYYVISLWDYENGVNLDYFVSHNEQINDVAVGIRCPNCGYMQKYNCLSLVLFDNNCWENCSSSSLCECKTISDSSASKCKRCKSCTACMAIPSLISNCSSCSSICNNTVPVAENKITFDFYFDTYKESDTVNIIGVFLFTLMVICLLGLLAICIYVVKNPQIPTGNSANNLKIFPEPTTSTEEEKVLQEPIPLVIKGRNTQEALHPNSDESFGEFEKSKWIESTLKPKNPKYIGKGGFGKVFSFTDPKDGTRKALKGMKMPSDEKEIEWTKEVIKEIEILIILNKCEDVINILEYKLEGQLVFIVMELADRSLYQVLHKDGSLTVNNQLDKVKMLKLVKCLSEGLSFAQSNNTNHGDMKPENILIMNNGNF